MKSWYSIEALSKDLKISGRSGWRWLRSGKIKKKRSEDGQTVFILADEPADETDTDDTDNVTTDVITDIEPISGVSTRRVDRQSSIRPIKGRGGPMSILKEDAYKSEQYDFKLEMLEDDREEYRERKNRARREGAEQARLEKLERFRIVEQQRQAEAKLLKSRTIIQGVKDAVLPPAAKDVYPALVMASIYQEIEKVLGRMDLIGVPLSELVILARDIEERIIGQNADACRESASNYLRGLAEIKLNQVMEMQRENFKKLYRESGSKLSYRDFMVAEINRYAPEKSKREEILSMIGV